MDHSLGATRDLTHIFHRHQENHNESHHQESDYQKLHNQESNHIVVELSVPKHVAKYDILNQGLLSVHKQIQTYRDLCHQRQNVIFNDSAGHELNHRIESQKSTILKLCQQIRKEMIQLEPIMQQRIGTQLQNQLKNFRQITQEHSDRISLENSSLDPPHQLEHENQLFLETGLESEFDQQRAKDIATLVFSVREIANLFEEVSRLIEEQGEIVDRIDYNIEQALDHTKKGTQELKQAESSSKSARTLQIICCLLIIVIVLIMVIVIKYE